MGVRYSPINSKLFVNNRTALGELMSKSSVLVLHSHDLMPRNGDCFFPFRQDSDFFYLTGIDQEESVLIMVPDAENKNDREVYLSRKPTSIFKFGKGISIQRKRR